MFQEESHSYDFFLTLSQEMRYKQRGGNINEASFEESRLRNSVLIRRIVLFQMTCSQYPSKSFKWHPKVTFYEQQDRKELPHYPIKL